MIGEICKGSVPSWCSTAGMQQARALAACNLCHRQEAGLRAVRFHQRRSPPDQVRVHDYFHAMKSLRRSTPYMSLPALDWADIPPFAIVTGLNGVGKTQFLSMLAAEPGAANLEGDAWRISSMELEPRPRSIGYLPALWRHGDVKISHEFFKRVDALLWQLEDRSRAPKTLDEFLQALVRQLPLPGAIDPIAARVIETLRSRGKTSLPIARVDVLAALGTYDLVTRDPSEPLAVLAQIFYAHVHPSWLFFRSSVPSRSSGA